MKVEKLIKLDASRNLDLDDLIRALVSIRQAARIEEDMSAPTVSLGDWEINISWVEDI